MPTNIQVIDSHTAGEPTRVIVDGGPDLGTGPLPERLDRFRDQYDEYRTATVREPRGSDVLVGALLCEPHDPSCDAGVIFFNNVGYLGMCGHGMIGLVETLRHMGRIQSGQCKIDTPVGPVEATLSGEGISINNVVSYREIKDARINIDGIGEVVGDVAWGGNWFFLAKTPQWDLSPSDTPRLQQIATKIRHTVNAEVHAGVDHVELFGECMHVTSNSRNFVLCPGFEYDRSPCGTGTSAKLACLAADGKLAPGETWIQEGILGTSFAGRFEWSDQAADKIIPTITGRAHVTAESRLLLCDQDPFQWGITS